MLAEYEVYKKNANNENKNTVIRDGSDIGFNSVPRNNQEIKN